MEGELLATFNSLTEAEKSSGCSTGNISRVCRNFIRARGARYAGGYVWCYVDDYVEGKMTIREKGNRGKAIIQLDDEGNEIAKYGSIVEASASLKCRPQDLGVAVKKGIQYSGYRWRFAPVEKKEVVDPFANTKDWKSCDMYPSYRVSPDGDAVFSIKRNGNMKTISKGKYPQTSLVDVNGKNKNVSLHRLVAKIYVPNPHNYPCVNHKDGNPSNSHPSNLEWCTSKQNTQHAVDTGLLNRKKAVIKLNSDGVELERFESLKKAAASVGVAPTGISGCCKGIHKTSGGFRWKYADIE